MLTDLVASFGKQDQQSLGQFVELFSPLVNTVPALVVFLSEQPTFLLEVFFHLDFVFESCYFFQKFHVLSSLFG